MNFFIIISSTQNLMLQWINISLRQHVYKNRGYSKNKLLIYGIVSHRNSFLKENLKHFLHHHRLWIHTTPLFTFSWKKKKSSYNVQPSLTSLLHSEINCVMHCTSAARSAESPGVRMSRLTSLAYNTAREAPISKDMLRLPQHKKRLTTRWAYCTDIIGYLDISRFNV